MLNAYDGNGQTVASTFSCTSGSGTRCGFGVECSPMMKSRHGKLGHALRTVNVQKHSTDRSEGSAQRAFTLEQVRLIADLRIMHAKVDELYQISKVLQQRHDERAVVVHADKVVLAEDIRKVDELYIWFVELKDEADRSRRKQVNGH